MYRERIRISAHIADIHIGVDALKAEDLKHQLYEKFIVPISQLVILDLITVNGDIAHTALKFNSKDSEVYIWFVDSIIKIAKKKGASVIFVRGTLSHDCDQMDNVRIYESDPDIFFADTPTVVETKGMKIYCLPDIHIREKEQEGALYDYPDNHFDMIMGHGSVTETQFIKQESEYAISKNIVYDSKKLLRICKGPILFGHIHSPMQIRDRIYYINSFSRFAHGEEADKGAMVTAYTPDTGRFIAERIINDLAPNFNAYTIKPQTFDRLSEDEIINKVDAFIQEYKVDKLALGVHYTQSDANVAKIHVLRAYYSKHKQVNKLVFKSMSLKEVEILEAAEKEEEDQKEYLRDKSLTLEEKMQRWIEEELSEKLSLEELEIILKTDQLLIKEGE